jgi:hypothetical protein
VKNPRDNNPPKTEVRMNSIISKPIIKTLLSSSGGLKTISKFRNKGAKK